MKHKPRSPRTYRRAQRWDTAKRGPRVNGCDRSDCDGEEVYTLTVYSRNAETVEHLLCLACHSILKGEGKLP